MVWTSGLAAAFGARRFTPVPPPIHPPILLGGLYQSESIFSASFFSAWKRQILRAPASMARVRRVHSSTAVVTAAAVSLSTVLPFMRSEEHTSELQSLMRTSYAVFCLTKKTQINPQ